MSAPARRSYRRRLSNAELHARREALFAIAPQNRAAEQEAELQRLDNLFYMRVWRRQLAAAEPRRR